MDTKSAVLALGRLPQSPDSFQPTWRNQCITQSAVPRRHAYAAPVRLRWLSRRISWDIGPDYGSCGYRVRRYWHLGCTIRSADPIDLHWRCVLPVHHPIRSTMCSRSHRGPGIRLRGYFRRFRRGDSTLTCDSMLYSLRNNFSLKCTIALSVTSFELLSFCCNFVCARKKGCRKCLQGASAGRLPRCLPIQRPPHIRATWGRMRRSPPWGWRYMGYRSLTAND